MIRTIYISGPISDGGRITNERRSINRELGRKTSLRLWDALGGVYIICPHINSPWTGDDEADCNNDSKADFKDIIANDLALIEHHIDILFMMPTWRSSKGAVMEHDWAKRRGIPVFYTEKKLVEYMHRSNSISCSVCGHLRYGMQLVHNRKVCDKCAPGVHMLMSAEIKKHMENFLPVPRM